MGRTIVQGVDRDVAAVPLVSRIHEGLVFSNRDSRTLLDNRSAPLCSIAKLWQYEGQSTSKSESKGEGKVVLVAGAYCGSGRFINQLLAQYHQLVTRAKGNAVTFLPPPQPDSRRRGRPRIYGKKVRLKDLALELSAFVSAPSPVYGENNVTIQYRCIDLLWRPARRLVSFVIVHHPTCVFRCGGPVITVMMGQSRSETTPVVFCLSDPAHMNQEKPK